MNDLASFLSRTSARQELPILSIVVGVVAEWSATSNRISAYGNQIYDVSYLAGLSFVPGDVIALLKLRSSYLALGKITTPTGA